MDLVSLAEEPLETLGNAEVQGVVGKHQDHHDAEGKVGSRSRNVLDAGASAGGRGQTDVYIRGEKPKTAAKFTARARAVDRPAFYSKGEHRFEKYGDGNSLHSVDSDDSFLVGPSHDSDRYKTFSNDEGSEDFSKDQDRRLAGGRIRRREVKGWHKDRPRHRRGRGRSRHKRTSHQDRQSDDHTSDSDNYDSVSGSEKEDDSDKFKVRYQVLREAYEERLKRLVTQMHSVYAETIHDDAVQALGSRPETAFFVPLRQQEVVREAIESGTEESFHRATYDLAKQSAELHRARKRIRELKNQVRTLSLAERDLSATKSELGNTQVELSRLRQTQVAETQELRETMQVLRRSLAESGEKSGKKMSEVEGEMAKRMNRMEVLVERMLKYNASTHNSGIAQGDSVGKIIEGKEGAAANAEIAKINAKLSKTKRLLAQSERERLELRQKYLAIGANVEQLIRADAEATNADIERWQGRYRSLRTKLQVSVKKCKVRAREIASLRRTQRDVLKAKADAEAHATKLTEALSECKVQLAKCEKSSEELANAQGKIAGLQSALERQQRESADEIDRARIEAREAQAERLTDAEVRVAKLEGELLRSESEQEARLEKIVATAKVEARRKYEIMVEQKLSEIRAAHEETLKSQENSRKEEDNLRDQVGQRLKEIAADHIPIAQHNTIVQAKLEACRAECESEMEATRIDAEREALERIEENSTRLTAQFSAIEAELRRSLAEGNARESDAIDARRDAEKAVEEERQALIRVKEELLDSQATSKKMGVHLAEASSNIERLKQMVTRGRTECARLQKALTLERSRRKDEEDLMKRELRQRTEKHQADAESLETQRIAVATAKSQVQEAKASLEAKNQECASLKLQLDEANAELTRTKSLLRDASSSRDEFEIFAKRNSRQVVELEHALEEAKAKAKANEQQHASTQDEERTRASAEVASLQQELLAAQKLHRAADAARLRLQDEVKAGEDRLESHRALSKERESALVKQLQIFRKTADESNISAEHAWSAQVEQLSQQLKDAHKSHLETQGKVDNLTDQLRQAQSCVREAESERDLAKKRAEAANTLALQHSSDLASLRGDHESLASAHDALKISDATKASALAKLEGEIEKVRAVAASQSANITKLRGELDEAQKQARKERESFEDALDEATREGDDLKEEHRKLLKKLNRAKFGLNREKQDHEEDVHKVVEDMEQRFGLIEEELRKAIMAKSIELEKAKQQLSGMQAIQDAAAEGVPSTDDSKSALVVQKLQSEVRMLRNMVSKHEETASMPGSNHSTEVELRTLRDRVKQFEADKAQLLGFVLEARNRIKLRILEATE